MPDSTLSALTASTPGTAGLLYTVQGGADRKLSMTAAGAQMLEAANAAAQQVLLGITGGGAISLGGYTLTIPATGTAALLGTANVFTTLQTITQASANTGILASTGYSLTGSNATNMIDLAGTWNTTGTPTAIKLNITNTASNAASALMDLQFSGTSKIKVTNTQTAVFGAFNSLVLRIAENGANDTTGFGPFGSNDMQVYGNNTAFCRMGYGGGNINGFQLISNCWYGWSDLFLVRKAAATLQLGQDAAGVTNQMFTAANRITSDGVGANLTIAPGNGRGGAGGDLILSHWTTGGAGVVGTLTTSMTINSTGISAVSPVTIAPSSAATCLTLTGGTVTTSNPLISATQTWNAVGTTFTGLLLNVTNTASASASKLLDLQFGGASKFSVVTAAASSAARTFCEITGNGIYDFIRIGFNNAGIPSIAFSTNAGGAKLQLLGDITGGGGAGEVRLSSDSAITWTNSTNGGTSDTYLNRDAANIIAQRNSTNAQTSRLYGTYTDASNYTRLSLAATSTTMTIAAETAGTGADNIDLTLTPAGTGVVQFGTHSALAAETVTGYITIKDAAGNSRKIAVVS